ncbi:MAG: hypothetical protein HS115_01260 [Spirochaetales bacterium]|nr:hypothetical protein [Spirochaetales bacterium]
MKLMLGLLELTGALVAWLYGRCRGDIFDVMRTEFLVQNCLLGALVWGASCLLLWWLL